jgi:hypothetical protein
MFGVKFKKLSNLKRFGEMVVATTEKIFQGKLSSRSTACMLVWYPYNHLDDVCHLFNVKTRHVIKVRDLIWLNNSKMNRHA